MHFSLSQLRKKITPHRPIVPQKASLVYVLAWLISENVPFFFCGYDATVLSKIKKKSAFKKL